MPSPRRKSSSRKRSAATRIQKRVRGKQTRKQVTKLKATRRIQSRVRGNTSRKLITRIKSNMLIDNDCSICFEPMTEKVATLLPCGHRFHRACINQWLNTGKMNCPLCRAALNPPFVGTSGRRQYGAKRYRKRASRKQGTRKQGKYYKKKTRSAKSRNI
jgi:hypothetical protein